MGSQFTEEATMDSDGPPKVNLGEQVRRKLGVFCGG